MVKNVERLVVKEKFCKNNLFIKMVDEIELEFVELRLAGQLLLDMHGNIAFLELNVLLYERR